MNRVHDHERDDVLKDVPSRDSMRRGIAWHGTNDPVVGYFHGFSSDVDRSNGSMRPVVLIERPDGMMQIEPASVFQFLDEPEGEGP